MRTTVTLAPDVPDELRKGATAGNVPLGETVNRLVRVALKVESEQARKRPGMFKVKPFSAGVQPGVDLDTANELLD